MRLNIVGEKRKGQVSLSATTVTFTNLKYELIDYFIQFSQRIPAASIILLHPQHPRLLAHDTLGNHCDWTPCQDLSPDVGDVLWHLVDVGLTNS
jgi:hypothetical protein